VATVTCGGGEKHNVQGAGTATGHGEHGNVRLLYAVHVPAFQVNLISGSVTCMKGAKIEVPHSVMRVTAQCRTVLMADSIDGLFLVRDRVLYIRDVPGSSSSIHTCKCFSCIS
jgi:hypothetical protein